MKKLYICILLTLIMHYAVAQKLTDKQIENFKVVALYRRNPIDSTLLIRKWTEPIYYKIYGTENNNFDNAVKHTADTTFAQLSKLTGMQIRNISNDDSVNFSMIIGDPGRFAELIPPAALQYFKNHTGNQTYYSVNNDGINGVVILVDPKQYQAVPLVQTIVQVQIVWGMGLFGKRMNSKGYSLFSPHPEVLKIQFMPDDALIIKTLYNKHIIHGMLATDINVVLKQINN